MKWGFIMSHAKTLVFFFTILLLTNFAGAECLLSEDIDNFVVVTEGDFEVIFGTSGSEFALNETVRFELIVTNAGSSPAEINFPVHYPDAILVSEVDCMDIQLCLGTFKFTHPSSLFYMPGSVNLDAGGCQKWTMAWDLTEQPAPVGTYKVWGGLMAWTDGQFRLPIGEWILPAEGATVLIDLVEAVATNDVSWSGIKALYR